MSRFYKALKEAERTGSGFSETDLSSAPEKESGKSQSGAANGYFELLEALAPNTQVAGEQPASGSDAPTADGGTRAVGLTTTVALDRRARLIPHTADEAIVEHYRRLRAKIIQEQEKRPFHSLVVTSPAPKEGKSVTTLNLALSCGMLPSYRVLVIDGDMRRGSLGKWLGVGEHPGFSELIEGTAELEDVVLKSDDLPVSFIVRGNARTPPAELLHSSRLAPQLRRMADYFSLILIDTPPVNLVADGQLLAGACDAVLLVARAFSTTRKALERTLQDLSAFRIIGSVLNGGMKADLYRHYKSYK